MRKATILIFVIALSSAAVFAQDELAQYQTWMKAGASANGALKKAIAASDAAAITEQAGKAAEAFDSIATYWVEKKNDEAAKLAMTARDAAKAVVGGDNAAAAKIGGTCMGCHAITREGNKFKS